MGGYTLKTSIGLIISIVNHLGTLLTFPTSGACNIDMLSTLIPSNIAVLAKSQ